MFAVDPRNVVKGGCSINAEQGSVPFPAITILQKTDWAAQAQLEIDRNPPECFLGQYDTTAPLCSSLNFAQRSDTDKCRCSDLWRTTLGDFTWHGGHGPYSSLEFRPDWTDGKLSPSGSTFMMLLKLSFYCKLALFLGHRFTTTNCLRCFQTTSMLQGPAHRLII